MGAQDFSDRARYARALGSGHTWVCEEIEKKHDLFGYPPQIVSVALLAIEQGRDPHAAIQDFFND